MTKKDFEVIAGVLRDQRERSTVAELWRLDETARAFADRFVAMNPRFNREIFLKACGVTA